MIITQNTTKMTFFKVSEEDLFTDLKLLKIRYQNSMQLNGATSEFVYEWIHWLKKTGNSAVYSSVSQSVGRQSIFSGSQTIF